MVCYAPPPPRPLSYAHDLVYFYFKKISALESRTVLRDSMFLLPTWNKLIQYCEWWDVHIRFVKILMCIYLCNTSSDLRQKFLVHKLSNLYFKIDVFDDGLSLPKNVAGKFNPFPPPTACV